mgnify:FL=1
MVTFLSASIASRFYISVVICQVFVCQFYPCFPCCLFCPILSILSNFVRISLALIEWIFQSCFSSLVLFPNCGPDMKYFLGFLRTQLSTTVTIFLVFGPKVRNFLARVCIHRTSVCLFCCSVISYFICSLFNLSNLSNFVPIKLALVYCRNFQSCFRNG